MAGCPAHRRVTHLLGLIAMMVALAVNATIVHAQIELAAIVGTVTDEEGQPLEGVTIQLRDIGRDRAVEVKTDRNGRFYRRGLRAIEYELVVEKEGYRPIQDRLTLSAGIDKRFNFKLARAAPAGAADFARGVEAFNRRDNEAAAAAFEAAVQKAPEAPEVRLNLGLTYQRLGREADAVAQFEKAVALAPDDPRVHWQLGGAYVEMANLAGAAAALEQGLALRSDLSDPLAWDATVTLGAVYFAQGETDKAIAQFEKALAVKPDAPAATLGLGKAWFSKGDAEQALRLFGRVVSAAPGTPEAAEAERFIKELEKATRPGP